jgi:hypothetical protein
MKTRRKFVVSTLAAGATLVSVGNKTVATATGRAGDQPQTGRDLLPDQQAHNRGQDIKDRAEDPKITRARLSPADKTSPAIPIGPHWMITWPFDAKTYGLPTTVRDKGAWVMFAGTPYSYLHVCGTPWDGNEYREGDRAVWTMSYALPSARRRTD